MSTPLPKKRKTAKPSSRPPAAHHLSHTTSLSPPTPLLPTSQEKKQKKQPKYSERSTSAISGLEAPLAEDLADLVEDVDLTQPSLGDQLAALSAPLPPLTAPSDPSNPTPSLSITPGKSLQIPPTSLSRTLAQALHSQDLQLLESCLSTSKPSLILSSVQRLPPHLALKLIDACVERLGRGARGAKGGGGAAEGERARGLVEWVRAVLVVHTGYLLTVPEVVTRLSSLYSILSTRLALHPRLLTLSGRLDLVLSQLEARELASSLPAPHALGDGKQNPKKKGKKGGGGGGRKYVEGESDDDQEREVVLERQEEEGGSVEDVELGGSEGEGLSEDEEEDEDDEEDLEGEDGEGSEAEEDNAVDVDMEDEEDEEGEGDSLDGEDDDSEDDDDDEEEEEEEEEAGKGVKMNGFIHDESEESE